MFTINEPNIMKKKTKFQQYFHCFIICILVPYPVSLATVEYANYLISAAFEVAALVRAEALISTWIPQGATLIRGRYLFQCGYPKVRRLFETPLL